MDGVVQAVRTITVSGTVTVLSSDCTLAIDQTAGAAISVQLPVNPREGTIYYIKDEKGDSLINAITVLPGSGDTVNGSSSNVISATGNPCVQYQYNFTTANWMIL